LSQDIIKDTGKLSVKTRILKAQIGGDSDTAKLNDRQLLILELLANQKQISVSDLCQCFKNVGQSTISMDVRSFCSQGWTKKRLSPTDERVHLIELTSEGVKKVQEIQKRAVETYLPLVKAIGKDENELRVLAGIVNRAIKELDRKLVSLDNDCS